MFWAWARKIWFFLEGSPVGWPNKFKPVPMGILGKLFFLEKKQIVLKFGNWAQKTWPLAHFLFSAGLTKLDFTSLKEPFEQKFLRRKGFFFQHVWTENKKVSASWITFLANMWNFLYVSTRTIWGNYRLKFYKIFNFLWPFSKTFVEQSREVPSRRVVGNFCQQ